MTKIPTKPPWPGDSRGLCGVLTVPSCASRQNGRARSSSVTQSAQCHSLQHTPISRICYHSNESRLSLPVKRRNCANSSIIAFLSSQKPHSFLDQPLFFALTQRTILESQLYAKYLSFPYQKNVTTPIEIDLKLFATLQLFQSFKMKNDLRMLCQAFITTQTLSQCKNLQGKNKPTLI